ncbi:MAG: pilin [Proteobacteria bacterium]|nr:MAG: pilin [Pseudomonadota bacterium]
MMRNEKGQGLVEYMILLALVVFVCVTSVKKLGGTIDKRFGDMDKVITSKIKVKINP